MKNFKFINGLSFLLALMLFNCNTPSNLLQDGDYDEAVYKAIMNLQKSKKKKEKDIIVVEEAFRKITAKDMAAIKALTAERQAANWVKINRLHNDIKERQELISPFLPLISSKTRYKADFRFVNIVPLELDSRNKAAQYYYAAALNKMDEARSGNKNSARNAYRKFDKVQAYFSDFKETNTLRNEAHAIGIDKVLFDLRNETYGYTPFLAGEELSFFDEQSLNDNWTKYYSTHNAPADIDYKVEVDITEIDMTPERIEHNEYPVTKKLFKTVRVPVGQGTTKPGGTKPGGTKPGGTKPGGTRPGGTRPGATNTGPRPTVVSGTIGTIGKPNNGRPGGSNNGKPATEKPKYEDKKVPYFVKARVFDTQINKAAFMSARVRFIDARNNRLLSSEQLAVEEIFSSFTSTFRGDERALPHEVKCRLNNNMTAIPRDSEMLLNAATQLKHKIKSFIRTEDGIVML